MKENTEDQEAGKATDVPAVGVERGVSHWIDEFPRDPGFYWFYGDQYLGQMGCHFFENSPPIEPKMQLIEVFKVSNGIMAKCDGQFFPSRKFDKTKNIQGYSGYFKKAELPKPPSDTNLQFG